jgi:hypothetical protein
MTFMLSDFIFQCVAWWSMIWEIYGQPFPYQFVFSWHNKCHHIIFPLKLIVMMTVTNCIVPAKKRSCRQISRSVLESSFSVLCLLSSGMHRARATWARSSLVSLDCTIFTCFSYFILLLSWCISQIKQWTSLDRYVFI